jgi:transposase
LQVVWHPKGQTPVLKLHPGREHRHFYGALDLQTGQELVMPTALMNSATSVLFLEKLLAAYPDQPILLLWDRAPWHRGPAIHALLTANPRLEILDLPPAAPDLNPQEHVWKAARIAVSHNHSERKLDTLAAKFEHYLLTNRFPSALLEQHGYNQLCLMFK